MKSAQRLYSQLTEKDPTYEGCVEEMSGLEKESGSAKPKANVDEKIS